MAQRDEIARLKGLKGRPSWLPGPMNSPPKADRSRHLRPEFATLFAEVWSLWLRRSAADG
jgi:hypothetical protein